MTAALRKWLPIAGIAILVIAIGAYFFYSGRESTDDAQIDGHITQIAARVGGTVSVINVKDNQRVKAGEVLVQIAPDDYQIAVDRAAAELADAQAASQVAAVGVPVAATTTASDVRAAGGGVAQAQAGVALAEGDLAGSKARLSAAEAHQREKQADATKAQRDVDRFKALVAKDEISQQQFDAAVSAAAAARAAADAATNDVSAAQQGVSMAAARIGQARGSASQAQAALASAETGPEQVTATRARAAAAAAHVQQAQATLAQAKLNLDYATVKAPADGIVSKKSVELGQVIQPGQPLLAIVQLEDVWLTANFKETQLRDIRVGQKASVSVDALGKKFPAHVDSVAPATGARFSLLPAENATGNYVKVVQRVPVKLVFDPGADPDRQLRPGLSATATVYTK
ncbi:MAG TPA: HlyD family secretion protein [Vicinamibacterales bacterium]|nr:HlyD family secretion protein [Vicinamibacterales bacterium]